MDERQLNIMKRITEVLKHEFDIKLKEIKPDLDLIKDVGLDSIQMLELVVSLENEFGFVIDDEELNSKLFQSMGKLAKYVEMKMDSLDNPK